MKKWRHNLALVAFPLRRRMSPHSNQHDQNITDGANLTHFVLLHIFKRSYRRN
jgi:hypothetical protein